MSYIVNLFDDLLGRVIRENASYSLLIINHKEKEVLIDIDKCIYLAIDLEAEKVNVGDKTDSSDVLLAENLAYELTVFLGY